MNLNTINMIQDRYLFCSGAYDGKVNLYSALRMELLMCYQITTMTLARNVNAVRFTSDGSRVSDCLFPLEQNFQFSFLCAFFNSLVKIKGES